ncbi:bifunctional metallophosphatase/5'-nucleotidase [Rheinheimera salexigens]|uniref:Bifunctional metallophosphatase/5'-nucleotidase n=1 Tax=Rheinheimera salexigens TaxID=1628148 RepID=A0A1E7Q5L4_9GAMM|nr:bifunctional metallophosphatase/5'-nucleotidase [Rheinheimera salexigens]OEY69447.1 bifunctional metallophosphatase/5'-nucleotidase [Rheinheimera salexigens]
MRFISVFLSVFILLSCSQLPPTQSEVGLRLSLIHINDTHSHFDPSPAIVSDADKQALYTYIGGHPRLLTQATILRQQATEQGIPALFLHGGDAFKGSAYFELFEQEINIDILNRLQLDAMAMGNHEFDIGLTKLADFMAKVNFPILAANIDSQAEPILSNSINLQPYQLFIVKNNQFMPLADIKQAADQPVVAVFGLALEDMRAIATNTGHLVFNNEIASAQATVNALTNMGIKHIIALTHLGSQRDVALAAGVNGIDAIVGGHSHSLLGDFSHWHLGQQPAYAELITNPDGKGKTCVLQAGQFAQAMGNAIIEFTPAGELVACVGNNTILASNEFYVTAARDVASRIAAEKQEQTERYIAALPRTAIMAEDATMRQVLNSQYLPAVQQAYGAAISYTETVINHVRLPGTGGSDQHGSQLAGYIADGMTFWLNQPSLQAKTGKKVDFALIGAGNIRAALEAGTVYEGNIRLEVLPFDTPLSVMSILGADIEKLLTDIISASLVPGAHTGKYPYSGNLRYVAQQTASGEAKLSQLQVWHNGQWQDIAADTVYTMATTSYLADGNDGWQHLQHIQQQHSDRVDIILQSTQAIQQPSVFAVKRVNAKQDSSGAMSYLAEYKDVPSLPCKAENTDCKAAAQAFIDYLQAKPNLWQTPRQPTVTLQR